MPKGGGGNRKHGRNKRKPTNQNYSGHNRRFKNKLKRIRQSNGEKAAKEYAMGKPCHAKRYNGGR